MYMVSSEFIEKKIRLFPQNLNKVCQLAKKYAKKSVIYPHVCIYYSMEVICSHLV
jgi:hypothetical protein